MITETTNWLSMLLRPGMVNQSTGMVLLEVSSKSQQLKTKSEQNGLAGKLHKIFKSGNLEKMVVWSRLYCRENNQIKHHPLRAHKSTNVCDLHPNFFSPSSPNWRERRKC